MSTASIGMTSSVFCGSTGTVSQELIFACLSVYSKTALLFIFCVGQSFAVLEGDFELFGSRRPALGNVLVIWNMVYPLVIALLFAGTATEHVNLL